ncbi:thioredoxin [Chryseobacterium carnipullorum]|jgi:thioredoxin 1|uniref:Thioredoxin n=9 Tax=Chryseobacterium group TaxID=2782232 RepID=A0A376EAL7_CHRCU|nr:MULTISPECIES: thioredoxin domain-containing protein [Chryseobacterium group]AZA51216.1 thioredoxin [Chryseobacterium carnipullorum]AZA56744.1 thioredoxin [Chryseobacterium shandongense]AZA66067.1 thioredoxin [Chryseobacterium carnipullorum]AZA88522.1 thioredoxin [Chryseobacterium shandongense]AZA97064.1 thioredoxin [Chryseobacterium shandongense]
MYKNLIVVFFLIAITGCGKAQSNKSESSLPAKEFSKKLDQTKDAQLVDVRTPGEFRNGHLKSAMNIDWNADDFTEKAKALDKDKPVFVYCMSGPRSTAAAAKLQEIGFKNVYEMQGGMMKWRNAELPEIKASTATGISLAQYKEMLKSNTPVLVDFYAEWCAPCKKMEPYLKKMAAEMPDKVKILRIDADANTELCKELNVSALPVLKLYKNDKLVWDNLGFATEQEVKNKIAQ